MAFLSLSWSFDVASWRDLRDENDEDLNQQIVALLGLPKWTWKCRKFCLTILNDWIGRQVNCFKLQLRQLFSISFLLLIAQIHRCSNSQPTRKNNQPILWLIFIGKRDCPKIFFACFFFASRFSIAQISITSLQAFCLIANRFFVAESGSTLFLSVFELFCDFFRCLQILFCNADSSSNYFRENVYWVIPGF